MKNNMHLIRPTTRFNLLILCYWLQCHLAGATLFYMPQPQAQMQQQQQQSQQQIQPQSQQQQPASTLLLSPPIGTPSGANMAQSQIASALENNGSLVQALTQMYAMQQQQANAAAGATGGAQSGSSANGTQQQAAPNSNQYVIKFIHNDSKNNWAYVSIMPVNHTNLHEPRIELRYQSKYPFVSLDEKSSNNTLVAAVLVNDEDSGPNGETSVSIEQGNELGHFKLVNTHYSRTILVNGAPLSRLRQPEYNLTIVARDHGSPPKSSSVNLVIKLNASSSSSSSSLSPSSSSSLSSGSNLPNDPLPSGSRPPVTDLMYVGAMLVVIFSALIFIIIIGCALVQRPKNLKGPPPRATSATNSRMHPSDHCLCVNLTNL